MAEPPRASHYTYVRWPVARLVAIAAALAMLVACEETPSSAPSATTAPATETTTSTTNTTAPPTFSTEAVAVDAARLGPSWRPGCPVGPEQLRLLRLAHWGFDGAVHEGELIVHADVVDAVVHVFDDLFAARFPIERMRTVDEHGADDAASMAANNTSAFNCRRVAGTSRFSEHAHGTAIDINPVQNPYVRGDHVEPAAGVAYLDRSDVRPGMLVADGPAVAAFREIGWGWGGTWQSSKDYQHLSASGR